MRKRIGQHWRQRRPGDPASIAALLTSAPAAGKPIALAAMIVSALCACSQKSAQELAADAAGKKVDIVAGVGDALQQKGEKAAESLATGLGSVVHGVGRGTLKSARKIDMDSSLASAGLNVTSVKDGAGASTPQDAHAIEAYLVAGKPVDGTLRMVAYDLLEREIGRSSAKVSLAGDQAAYVALPLAPQVEMSDVARVAFKFIPAGQVGAK